MTAQGLMIRAPAGELENSKSSKRPIHQYCKSEGVTVVFDDVDRVPRHGITRRLGLPQPDQRSNFVDRMIDEVVRSTPSNAPMRSIT